jgi:hypothetical protein
MGEWVIEEMRECVNAGMGDLIEIGIRVKEIGI